jgi:membrane-associated phospholipid phosphatase
MKKSVISLLKEKISFKRYPVAFISLFLILFLLILLFFNRFLFAPKILLFGIIILVAVILGKLQILLKDWFFFLSFLYLFDSLRGTIYILTCKLNLPVYTLYVIKSEKFLFGNIPSLFLQNALLKTSSYGEFGWLERFLTVIHGTHFLAFLFIGLIIWLHHSNYFRAYKSSFYWVTAIGVSGYFAVPTVPPWLASWLFHFIPELTQFNIILYNMTNPDITSGFNTNVIAAMPSLHAAFPALCSLILWRLYRWKASLFYFYTLLVFFTIVYTGDHYVVDIIAGVILAIPCYLFAFRKKNSFLGSRLKIRKPFEQKENSAIKKNAHLILGGLILSVGIFIGLVNKNQFENHANSYDYSFIPKYIDFFNHEEDYRDNYYVQSYFGNYFLFRQNFEKALSHYNQALSLSKTLMERKRAQMRIRQCHLLLSRGKMK